MINYWGDNNGKGGLQFIPDCVKKLGKKSGCDTKGRGNKQ
jgi:hypothetical protein